MLTNLCANPNAKVLRPKNCDLSSALSQAAFRTDTKRFSSSQIAPNFLMASNKILLDRFFSAYFCLTTIILTLITHKVQRVSKNIKLTVICPQVSPLIMGHESWQVTPDW